MRKRTIFKAVIAATVLWAAQSAFGQFAIPQSVTASGGGTSSGGQFSVTGTIGQPIAGRSSSGPPYLARGGFWQFDLAPTAAPVSIMGRVVTDRGRSISRAVVAVTDMKGQVRRATSNSFGYFRIDGLTAGEDYVLAASHRQYRFDPVLVTAKEDIADARLIGTRP